MTNTLLIEKLDKEVQVLRHDIREIKSILLKRFSLPEEGIKEYENVAHIRKAYRKAVHGSRSYR